MTLSNAAVRRFAGNAFPESDFAIDVLQGLSRKRKVLSPRYFYDAMGSELFEEITQLPEYYLTSAEMAILNSYSRDISDGASEDDVLLEFGSGSSRKTEILLDALPDIAAYIPIDVSKSALENAQLRLSKRFPKLVIRPIVGDFSNPLFHPRNVFGRRRIGFFPGSTIGNSTPIEAVRLLAIMRNTLGHGGRLIIGVDLKKDAGRLVAAYNDSRGVTAAFNVNLLARVNRELDGDFDLSAFEHCAIYNPQEGRIEMHLVSIRDQTVKVHDQQFEFQSGESIHTENSYKYSAEQFQALAEAAGWNARQVWMDDDRLFSVHELVTPW
jgi:dimethylhistidine N-methyltransferase